MINNQLPDTPWDIGYAKKKENDPRRHKSRCIHIEDGICKLRATKCVGSAHCNSYNENKNSYKCVSYGIKKSNTVSCSEEVRSFVQDKKNEIRRKFCQKIFRCPICNKEINWYKPLPHMAKSCTFCNVLFVNEDIYTTYTEDINKNMDNYILCLVGLTPPRKLTPIEKKKRKK